jgi:hypothetical protein
LNGFLNFELNLLLLKNGLLLLIFNFGTQLTLLHLDVHARVGIISDREVRSEGLIFGDSIGEGVSEAEGSSRWVFDVFAYLEQGLSRNAVVLKADVFESSVES